MGCGGKELLPQETICPTFFSHILKSMNLLLALSLSWFPAGQSWQITLCFILNCSKHVRKLLTLLSLKVAGTHLLVTPRPGDHCCLSEIKMIVPEHLADCYNMWSFTASSWNPETELIFFFFFVCRGNYLCLEPLLYQYIKIVFHPVLLPAVLCMDRVK